jgi:predicted heme/steroid binding protein
MVIKMLKKIAIISAALFLTLGLAACNLSLTTNESTTTSSQTSTTQSTQTTTTQRTFTLAELATYNGDDGTTAYIAVNGIVYDVTHASDWTNGWHKELHLAGTDATTAFAGSPHSASLLNSLTIVGTLVN